MQIASTALPKSARDPSKFQFTEDNIDTLIKEAEDASAALFADRKNPHNKIEYVRAHFGTMVCHGIKSTWRNTLGFSKEKVLDGLRTQLVLYEINKITAAPCIMFIKHMLEPLCVECTEETSGFSRVLDETKLRERLKAEYDAGVEAAIKKCEEEKDEAGVKHFNENLKDKYEEHLDSEEGKQTYAIAKKYIDLMAKIYYFKLPKH